MEENRIFLFVILVCSVPCYHYIHHRHSSVHTIKLTHAEKKTHKFMIMAEILLIDLIREVSLKYALFSIVLSNKVKTFHLPLANLSLNMKSLLT